ncbi:hypothetical protein ILUMI_20017, partial [Ignelater luminosus]
INRLDGLTIVTGTNSLRSGGDVYKVKKIIPHEGFSMSRMRHDIALVKVSQPIKMSRLVRKINLPTTDTPGDQGAMLSGWGAYTFPQEKFPDKLQKLGLKTLSHDRCSSLSKQAGNDLPIYPDNICTITQAGKGACHGDSGGPLASSGVQIGVVSWGKPCAKGAPDVFARVYKYLDWINRNMRN